MVNNKLVRNTQAQQHNTNSSQQNMDKLLTDYDTQSAIKISPCPSEERLHEANGALSKTFVKNKSQASDCGGGGGINNSFNNGTAGEGLHLEYLNTPSTGVKLNGGLLMPT